MISLTQKQLARLWGKIDKDCSMTFYKGSRCWEWKGSCYPNGYGRISVGHTDLYTHRLMYELTFGEIPHGLLVCHHCDNPPCCNPEHLFSGTSKENTDDMIQKNRKIILRGEDNPRHKITDEQVDEIRRRYAWFGKGGEDAPTLAKAFGIGKRQIQAIVRGESRKK